MTSSVTIHIDTIHGGAQLRAYGPHVYEAKIAISLPENAVGAVYYLQREYAERVIKALLSSYCEGGEGHSSGMDHYYSPHLQMLERTEFEARRRAVWRVRIETPFTD